MKKLILIAMLFTSTLFFAQSNHSNIKWETNFKAAKKAAKKTKKPILMLFTGSDWCPPCKSLKRDFFNSEKFKKYTNKFVFMYVDFPRNKELVTVEEAAQNRSLNNKYKVRSLPIIIVVNANGEVIDKIKGYNSTGETKYHYEFVNEVLSK